MRMKIFLLTLALCVVPMHASAQATTKVEPVTNNGSTTDGNGKPRSASSHEHKMDGEALAFLLGEYMRRTNLWAPPADAFLKIPSRNFVHGYPNGSLVWPDDDDPRNKDAWDNILKSQGVSMEKMAAGNVAAADNVMVFISEDESQEFAVGTGKVVGSSDPLIAISFGKGFYCYPLVSDRSLPLTPNECFLSKWRGPTAKDMRSETELAYRIVLMAGWLHEFNELRNDQILKKFDACFNDRSVKRFRKIREVVVGLEREKQSGQINEGTYAEKLDLLEREAREIASSEQTRNCAGFLFRHKYGAADVTYNASQRVTVCPKPGQDCKKPGDLSRAPLPTIMAQFLRYGSKKSALENYVRHMLPQWYPPIAALYKPIWDTYKVPR